LLVISHDAALQVSIRSALEPHGWHVTEATSEPLAVLAYAASRPMVVILDAELPGGDWTGLCRRIKAMPRGRRVPLLVRAASVDCDLLLQAFGAGAHNYMVLPKEIEQLPLKMRYVQRAAEASELVLRTQSQLERAQEMAVLGSWALTADGREITASRMLCSMLGLRGPDLTFPTQRLLDCVHPEDRAAVIRHRDAAIASATGYRMTYRVVCEDTVRTMSEVARVAVDEDGIPLGIEGITQDITEKVTAQRTISYLSRHQTSTGLPNHSYFLELCESALRAQPRSSALLHIEIDRYGTLFSALTESRSMAILRTVSERIQSCVRGGSLSDAENGEDVEATIGHDAPSAFTVLLMGVEEADALRISDRILRVVAQPLVAEGTEVVARASAGVAMFPKHASDARTLAQYARQAHQTARSLGASVTRFYDVRMSTAARERLYREAELRHAITNGELRLAYQPKIDAVSGRITGAEALVRWMHPQRGLLRPDKFIPLAEESGLIAPLTDWVLETACADLAARHERGLIPVPVSVNFASTSFQSSGDIQQMRTILGRHGIEPRELMIEVTETLLMKDSALAVRRVKELRAEGFRLSLDDFGTGYSALSHFKMFQVDELKIDRSFITEADRGGRDAGIVCAITALGREFGIDVCAEGVETNDQAEFLKTIGCNLHQGYLYAKPLQGMDFDNLLEPSVQDRLPWLTGGTAHIETVAMTTRTSSTLI
jgi:PAS domain S-box-containing protein